MNEEEDLKRQRQTLIAEIRDLADEYVQLSRQAVAIAWQLGGKLIEAKELYPGTNGYL